MPDYILKAAIFKFKMAAGYHVDSDGYPVSRSRSSPVSEVVAGSGTMQISNIMDSS